MTGRLVHLGLGSFFRSHQAWYTAHSTDAQAWGYTAFSGRHGQLAALLSAQRGRYTLVTRGPDADRFESVSVLDSTVAGSDAGAWRAAMADPATAVVTLTVTEAAYADTPGGVPERLADGLDHRRRAGAGAGPLAVVPCDNLPANGGLLGRLVSDAAGRLAGGALQSWIESQVSFVDTVVDRITPATTAADRAAVAAATGWADRAPVVTEPYSEWVLAGAFPAGRPAWESAGASFVDDVTPWSARKLWMLNGAHSLLAYAGPLSGHASVASAAADPLLEKWVGQWWQEAGRHLPARLDPDAYGSSLLRRWSNRRLVHDLDQVAADGSVKLAVRVLPVVRLELAAGRVPPGAARILGAWVAHLRSGRGVHDPRAAELTAAAGGPLGEAARRVLGALDPEVAADREMVEAVAAAAGELTAGHRPA